MRQFQNPASIFDIVAIIQATFTAAVTGIITANAHGFVEGTCIQVSSGTTLPAGLSASTNYYVIEPTTNTFKVSATRGGTAVTISDTGTDTHTLIVKGKPLFVVDFKNLQLSLNTSGDANLTVKIQGSDQDGVDFNAAQSATNRWEYLMIKDLNDNASITGDTGIALTGTDDHRSFEININAKRWISANITAWSAGKLNLISTPFSD